jgi:hypothetical protein
LARKEDTATFFHQPSSLWAVDISIPPNSTPCLRSSAKETARHAGPNRGGYEKRKKERRGGGSNEGAEEIRGRGRREGSMERSVSRTTLNCISLADPDTQKSVALLKQVRGSLLYFTVYKCVGV